MSDLVIGIIVGILGLLGISTIFIKRPVRKSDPAVPKHTVGEILKRQEEVEREIEKEREGIKEENSEKNTSELVDLYNDLYGDE